ncbi:unnamed protein product, partial [marine sediment metagenome]
CSKTVKISIIMLNITYSYGCLSNIIKIRKEKQMLK